MKKSTFLFNLLATTALATGAHAGVIQGSGWSYDSETGVLEITGYVQYEGVTGHVDGNSLPGLGAEMSSVTSIRFGEGVTQVSGFNGTNSYYKLTSVSFPSTLEKIADNAFGDKSNLTSVTFDPGATGLEIGAAFGGCSNLSQVELPDNVKLATGSFSTYYEPSMVFVLGKMDEGELDYYSLSSAATIICKDSSCVTAVQNSEGTDYTPLFAPDESGVYSQVNLSSGSQAYYASLEDLLNNSSCETYDVCKVLAAANNSSTTGGGNGGSGGSVNNNSGSQSEPKRIYTLEEARQAVEAAGTETVNFRIRYK